MHECWSNIAKNCWWCCQLVLYSGELVWCLWSIQLLNLLFIDYFNCLTSLWFQGGNHESLWIAIMIKGLFAVSFSRCTQGRFAFEAILIKMISLSWPICMQFSFLIFSFCPWICGLNDVVNCCWFSVFLFRTQGRSYMLSANECG